MPLNIPNTELPGTSFLKGIDTGSTMFTRLMHPILERERQKRQAQQFAQELALKKQQEARMGANSGLTRQLLEQQVLNWKHKNDPKYALQQLQEKLNYIQSLGNQGDQQGGAQQQPQNAPPQDMMKMLQGQQEMPQGQGPLMQPETQEPPQMSGMGMPEPQQGNQALPGGLDMDMIKRALTYQALGLKPPANGVYKEPPELKRQNDLRAKMEEARYKHELKQAEEQQKVDLKNEQTKHKVIESAKNDLPHLKETLRSLKIMKKIADDPKNEDMFGHWLLGHDRAAQRTNNPNAGTWQIHGLGPIVEAEMKMSNRGNQLALKSALNNKPNFGEDRGVAANKLNASIDQIERRIKDTQRIANESTDDFSKMSDEELRAIVGGQ